MIKRIVVTYGATIPTAPYANTKVEFTAEADVGASQAPQAVMRDVLSVLVQMVQEVKMKERKE